MSFIAHYCIIQVVPLLGFISSRLYLLLLYELSGVFPERWGTRKVKVWEAPQTVILNPDY